MKVEQSLLIPRKLCVYVLLNLDILYWNFTLVTIITAVPTGIKIFRWLGTMRAAPKLMPPILLCWPTTSEANVVDMAVEVEPSRQYSIKFCCCMTDDSRGALWQNGVWHGSAYETKVCNWIPLCGKNCIQWHSPMLAKLLRRPNNGC